MLHNYYWLSNTFIYGITDVISDQLSLPRWRSHRPLAGLQQQAKRWMYACAHALQLHIRGPTLLTTHYGTGPRRLRLWSGRGMSAYHFSNGLIFKYCIASLPDAAYLRSLIFFTCAVDMQWRKHSYLFCIWKIYTTLERVHIVIIMFSPYRVYSFGTSLTNCFFCVFTTDLPFCAPGA
jgi:hypothetical protein